MSVAYLLPSNRRELLATQVERLSAMCNKGDEVVVSTIPGMTAALRECFEGANSEVVRNCGADDDYLFSGSL